MPLRDEYFLAASAARKRRSYSDIVGGADTDRNTLSFDEGVPLGWSCDLDNRRNPETVLTGQVLPNVELSRAGCAVLDKCAASVCREIHIAAVSGDSLTVRVADIGEHQNRPWNRFGRVVAVDKRHATDEGHITSELRSSL